MRINIDNEKDTINNDIEIKIINNLNRKLPNFYFKITDSEINNIINILNIKINRKIIRSIKILYTKNYIIKKNYKLNLYSDDIIQDYKNKINILKLCKKYNISPLTLLRFIINNIYNIKLTNKINYTYENKLNFFDIKQLNLAIKNDYYSTLDQTKTQKRAEEFEYKIENILNKMEIKFKTQNELVGEQIKIYGRPIITPDFLIISNLYINNIKINWIDAKNFYGANINFFIKKLKVQQNKYIDKYGSGCIIFSLGYNSDILKNQTNKNMLIYSSYKVFKSIIEKNNQV